MHAALELLDREFPGFASAVSREPDLWDHRATGDLAHLRRVLAALAALVDVGGADADLVEAAVDGAMHLFRPQWRCAHRDDRNLVIRRHAANDDGPTTDLEAIVRCATGDISPDDVVCDFVLDVAACLRLAVDWADDCESATWVRERVAGHGLDVAIVAGRRAFSRWEPCRLFGRVHQPRSRGVAIIARDGRDD